MYRVKIAATRTSRSLAIFTAGLLIAPTGAFGLTGLGLTLELSGRKGAEVFAAPVFTGNRIHRSSSLSLHRRGAQELGRSLTTFLRSSGLQLELTPVQNNRGLQLNGSETITRFEYNGVPICQYKVKATTTSDGDLFISGQIPSIQTNQSYGTADFGTSQNALNQVGRELRQRGISSAALASRRANRCIFVHIDGSTSPAWEIIATADGLPYFAWASEREVFHLENRYFSAVGMTKVFKKNPDDGKMGFVTIGNLIGDGSMTSGTFAVSPGSEYGRARSCTHEFLYEPNDPRFAESSAFTHATRMLSWYNEKFQYTWNPEAPRMEVKLREVIGGSVNNALYVPAAAENEASKILIGEGDGVSLKNLMYDADVVSHEFGHHIVFQSITSIEGESLVLHEGLADFFTFAQTGDPCLGESICPEGSDICWQEGCLRTADNDLKLGDDTLPEAPHLRSQFISGFLWDLYEHEDYAASDLTKSVYRAVSYLSESSSYTEFVTSLVQADDDLYGGRHCQLIVDTATERGMGKNVSKVECDDDLALGDTSTAKSADTKDTQYILAINDSREAASMELTDNCALLSQSKRKSKTAEWTSCGQISILSSKASHSRLFLLFLIFVPLVFLGVRRQLSR